MRILATPIELKSLLPGDLFCAEEFDQEYWDKQLAENATSNFSLGLKLFMRLPNHVPPISHQDWNRVQFIQIQK